MGQCSEMLMITMMVSDDVDVNDGDVITMMINILTYLAFFAAISSNSTLGAYEVHLHLF